MRVWKAVTADCEACRLMRMASNNAVVRLVIHCHCESDLVAAKTVTLPERLSRLGRDCNETRSIALGHDGPLLTT